ncbi:photosynthetic NDH subunit of lumenal location 3, chloroplastic-like isoform X2 [Chenopodium quinoa]|uniref:photosynthetic NDH subunit of lumenal location 3, chloroplastic-like isoform X2 n=1 Tax=Chenopodium quinoa TaxID=63459 RepID=UPI000B7808F3|nr:photosynthetic NDH subunit of lumenal location 3, chloroplastic-like isoform X2 [Chenopodium quinoa]
MAQLGNLYGITESLPAAIPNVPYNLRAPTKKSCNIICHAKKIEDFHQNTSRRSVISIASIALFTQLGTNNASLAEEENRLWLDYPLPGLRPAENKIANEETGTRSFLKKGLYMANIGTKGSAYRLGKYAFDLMALGDLIGQDTLNYVRKYLRLKGTFMYYDFDKVISAAPVDDKQPLTDLANRLFNNFEKIQEAIKLKDLAQTRSTYDDTTVILQEVMDRFA